MRARSMKPIRTLLAAALAAAALGVSSSTAAAATPVFNLCAVPGSITVNATSVPIWGFGAPTTPGNCSTATASLPGPLLDVNVGDTVTINVINALPPATAPLHQISLEIPGTSFTATSTQSAAVGGTATVVFTASAPGTYLYQSGGDSGRQEAMGLYGALIVRSATPNQAYNSVSTAYDGEATLVLSQVDPLFNANPDTYNMYDYLATFWLVNGTSYPGTTAIPAPGGGRRLLIRYLNAGYDNTSMLLLGMRERVLARDARLLLNPFDAISETVPSGGTEDAIAVVPVGGAPSASGFPLYNRQLHLTAGSPAVYPGGMLTFIQP